MNQIRYITLLLLLFPFLSMNLLVQNYMLDCDGMGYYLSINSK